MKLTVFLLSLLLCSVAHADDAKSDFFEQVLPILQTRCVGCHSDGESKGDFSVESKQSVLDSGFIEPGDAESSRLIEVITPVDGKAEMPKGKPPLTTREIEVLKEWVASGAPWPSGISIQESAVDDFDWWSLRPLTRPEVPVVSSSEKIRTPIDAFIQSRLDEQGLVANEEADRRTLARRLYFDLIGLPPTPEQIDEFASDDSPDAYQRLVDSLLDSKHYGERWARHWLDVVHYADTHGYDKDKLRPNAWPYRDYVIRSLNNDKDYSRFVQEQIAGDVLWPHTVDGITATGFIAAGPWDFIGHAEVPESKIDGRIARHLDRDDMVASTMNTFTSTTVQCARCHNHKFDPITQEHYYSLQTVFAALDRADRTYDADPAVSKERSELASKQRALRKKLDELDTRVDELGGDKFVGVKKKIRELEKEPNGPPSHAAYGYHNQLATEQRTEKWVQVDLGASLPIDRIEIVGAHDNFGGIGDGFGFPVRYRIEVSDDASFKSNVNAVVDRTKSDAPNPGTSLQEFSAMNRKARYVRMTATKLAHRVDQYIFAVAEMTVVVEGKNVASTGTVTALDSIEALPRWGRANLVDGIYPDASADVDKDGGTALEAAKAERGRILQQKVPVALRREVQDTRDALQGIAHRIGELPKPNRVYAGTIHHGSGAFKGTGECGGKPRTIHVLHRGDILQPRQLAKPGRIPLSPDDDWRFDVRVDASEGSRRVALARWLTDRTNPLTWRSIVNRIWHYHFGAGIVDSPNDFGRMGATPSHPDLLNWLAVEFRDNGQSLKSLHRLIVNSAVYRRASTDHPANATKDGGNRFLWRMNRRRLSAEEVRDSVLCVAGKMNHRMYGPGVRLFELERPEHSPHYEYHKHDPNDPESHRRSIYRFIVRSQPDPFMTTLDCADSSQSVPRRIETVTPLQALSMMNNKFMLSMSRHFANRLTATTSDTRAAIQEGFRLTFGRIPTEMELIELTKYAKSEGLENACRLMFNLNEFVFVD